ncbi:TolC family protein [Chlorogloea sp. CCALA 695]|uniref:TolC family protein n=1 Tax=Chlorogloea sp. CCALA 695 TaxID=2107693 RepID=UPI000D0592F6|nr:TolC family protein [Chlorogloea sp. CCALA 695]PSB32875.1 transporter [Chlorogloea sp. CCALA 695]
MRQIFNNFCLASTIVVLVQSVGASQVSAEAVTGIYSKSQTIKLKVSNFGQKIKRVKPSNLAQTPGFPQNLRSPTEVLPQSLPAPSKFNPSPNPLQFPTKPDEVRLEPAEGISLQQAFELARRNNRQLQIAILTLDRSSASVREAQAQEYPTLSIQGGLNSSASDVFSYDANQQRTGSTGSSTALRGTVELSYNVYTAGERTARIRAAEEQLRFDQLDVERLTEQLRLDVSNDYYDLQQADEQVRINRAAVTNAEASLRDAQALEQAGVGTRFDVLRSQVQLANANQNLTNALSQQQVSRRQLVNRLSLAQVANAIASDPVEIAGVWNLPLEESIIQAFQNRAELQQELVQRNISEQNRRIALASIKPRVAVSSNYNISDTFSDDESFGDDYSLGANVTWNLYDGGAARASARAQSVNIAIAETSFADTRNQVRFEVEEAYSNLQSNLANIQTASVALEQAREALRLARLRFQAGVGTQTDVISAENDLTQAEGNRVTAILDYNRALASLTRAISSGSAP